MSKKYHYVYRITNKIENKHYYGCRTTKLEPKDDLGSKYFSSAKDMSFIKDQKENPHNYKYKIIKIFSTREEAINLEIRLHSKFNVGINPKFYNQAKQTTIKRDTTGMFPARNKDGEIFMISRDDPRFISGELTANSKQPRGEFTLEHRENLSKALTGKPKSKEHIQKGIDTKLKNGTYKGKNHPRFKGYYVTPMGTFESPAALIPIISLTQMKMFCDDCDRLISKASYNNSRFLQLFYTYDEIKDRTYEDLGFWRDYI